jgi:transcriptional regulator with XRE-family HTH domain
VPRLTDYLTQLRQTSGLSYAALAERAHDERGHLQRVFTGAARPKRDTLLKLCIALGLDVAETDTVLRLANFPGLLPPPAPQPTAAELESGAK